MIQPERNRTATVEWTVLGRMGYEQALEIQQTRRDALLAGEQEHAVYAVEHPPTITIGRGGTADNIVASKEFLESIGMSVYEVDRGGDVTYHGPGQLVLYPVFHLNPWQNDIGRYVRGLEESVIQALAGVGIKATRLEGYPGVWVGQEKICAIGVRAKRKPSGEFVTAHGLALNVSTNLAHFATIIPCGITDKGVTSIEKILGTPCDWDMWEERLRQSFQEIFDIHLVAPASADAV